MQCKIVIDFFFTIEHRWFFLWRNGMSETWCCTIRNWKRQTKFAKERRCTNCCWYSFSNFLLIPFPSGPRGLRRRSAADRLLRSWVRIPLGAWMSFCCECCVLSGRCLCVGLITRPEESYLLWCVVVCDLLTCWDRGFESHRERIYVYLLWLLCVVR